MRIHARQIPARIVDGAQPLSIGLLKIATRSWRARALNRFTPTSITWNGHNASGWRTDVLEVNGFDERMGYWAEDRELGERLVNAGIQPKQIRYKTTCVHLEHGRPYLNPDVRAENLSIRRSTRLERRTWTPHGIKQA